MKKLNYFIIFCVFVFYCFSNVCAAQACAEKMKVIEPLSETQMADLLSWERAHDEALPADLSPDLFQKVYVVDINNDGIKEYVVTVRLGTGGTFMMFLFLKNKNGDYKSFEQMWPEPQNLTAYASKYDFEYENPLNKKTELFFEMCGKTYISTHNFNKEEDAVREIFLWEKSEMKLMCTPEWVTIHRSFFQKLYDQSMYTKAQIYLNGVLQSCENMLSKKNIFWLKNDIALTAFKNTDPQTCLEYLGGIKKDPIFQSTFLDTALSKAVTFNEKLCQNKLKTDQITGNAGVYDYSWLFESHGFSSFDGRYDELLSAVVPHINHKKWKTRNDLLKEFKPRLYYPLGDQLKFKENRFLTFAGDDYMTCNNRGFIWIDIKNSISAMALNLNAVSECGEIPKKENTTLILGSRSISRNNLPQEFINDLKTWLKEEKIVFKNALFYDYSENSKDVTNLLQ